MMITLEYVGFVLPRAAQDLTLRWRMKITPYGVSLTTGSQILVQ